MGHVLIKWDSTVILCGDMNIDIIKVNDLAYRIYRDILKGHGLKQHVTPPTRNRTWHHATCHSANKEQDMASRNMSLSQQGTIPRF